MIASLLFVAAVAGGGPVIGRPAPAFSLTDTDGKEWSLTAHRGKTVVLEWFNPDCPFVVYAHGEGGPLASLPGKLQSDEVVWVAINSGAEGKQGAGKERNQVARTEYAMNYPVLLDVDGSVGRSYGAKTTPHMYVVDPSGNLAYAGALDNAPRGERTGELIEYVSEAVSAVTAGKPVSPSETKAYGCSVKYGEPVK